MAALRQIDNYKYDLALKKNYTEVKRSFLNFY